MTGTYYGMPKLGQLAKFLRDTITDDVLFTQSSDKKYESLTKHWDRYCSETSRNGQPVKDYIDYAWHGAQDEIPCLFMKFFDSEKELPEDFSVFIMEFFDSFYKSLINFNPYPENMEGGKLALVAENSTENYVLFKLCISLCQLLMKLEKDYGIQKSKEFISFYLDKLNYKNLFSEILKKGKP